MVLLSLDYDFVFLPLLLSLLLFSPPSAKRREVEAHKLRTSASHLPRVRPTSSPLPLFPFPFLFFVAATVVAKYAMQRGLAVAFFLSLSLSLLSVLPFLFAFPERKTFGEQVMRNLEV